MTEHKHISIVGAGFPGLGMGIRLKQAGIDDFTIFERARAPAEEPVVGVAA